MGLSLLWAGGCPSKPSPDANSPREQKTEDRGQNTEASGEVRDTRYEIRDTNRATSDEPPAVARYGYKVIRTWPHDPQAFTQGLVYEDGSLYEGTGLHGQSALIKRSLETAEPLKRERLPRRYFGEGITIFRDKIIQLTWQSQTGFVYDKSTFRLLREFAYRGEGWGLTHDGRQLIMSDGTAALRFLDPNTFVETRRIIVRDRGRPVRLLNELEFIPDSPQTAGGHGSIFANIWSSDSIVVIDPDTGEVTGRLDLSGLWPRRQRPSSEHVLNGIAWLPQTNRLLITGKCWPKLYEIEIIGQVPANQQ